MSGSDSAGTWTVFLLRDDYNGEIHVAGVLPGDQATMAVCPPGDTFLVPEVQTVVASSAWEAAFLATGAPGEPERSTAPPVVCVDCARVKDEAFLDLRNAVGHDKFGHRLSNALKRADVGSIAELREVSDARLLDLFGFGPVALQRIRSARRGRARRVGH